MKVSNILGLVAAELNLDEYVRSHIQGVSNTTMGQEDANNLLSCFNLVENTLAVEYLPLYAEDEILAEAGVVFFDTFTRKPVRIVAVYDERKNSLAYTVFPEYLKTQAGMITVRYTYAPQEKTMDGECDYRLGAYKQVLVYGVANEYCLACGRFEEAEIWEKKYRRALKNLYKMHPSIVLRTRRWA